MGLSFLAPFFLAGLLAIAVPILIHLIRRYQGRKLPFPSLMFLRQLPVKAVKRRQIRDWPLFLLRVGALTLIALAFARPVLQFGGGGEEGLGDGLREVVIVVDRSWSMSQGDRWERAQAAVRSTLAGLVNPDRVSLIVFDGIGRVVAEPTLEPSRIRSAMDSILPGWGTTQIGAGLQAAGGLLQNSERSRKEVVLISDFQRRGWEDGPRDRLPPGTRLLTIDVGDDGLGTTIVSDVQLEYSFAEGRQRVQPTARIARQAEGSESTAQVTLEIDGREVESRTISLPEEGSVPVPFDPLTLPPEGFRGSVRLEVAGRVVEPFRFTVSPQAVLSILLIESTSANTPYLRSALSVGGGPPVRVQTRTNTNLSPADLQGVDLVLLNDVPLPAGSAGQILREHVMRGGGLLVVTGGASNPSGWEAAWDPLLPGRVGTPVDRASGRGGGLARLDRDHPILTPFAGVAGGGLGAPRFFRYRSVEVAAEIPAPAGSPEGTPPVLPGGSVIAYFDDGTPALLERSAGAGRVLLWTSSMETGWADFPLHPVFLPLVQEMARYAAARQESPASYAVAQPLDQGFLLRSAGFPQPDPLGVASQGGAGASGGDSGSGPAVEAVAVLVGPDGRGVPIGWGGSEPILLPTPGFYEVRQEGGSTQVRSVLAVNPDIREADPTRIEPEELVIAAAPRIEAVTGMELAATGALAGQADRNTVRAESERRQGAWRFLLLGAILLLIGESFLAGRMRPIGIVSDG